MRKESHDRALSMSNVMEIDFSYVEVSGRSPEVD